MVGEQDRTFKRKGTWQKGSSEGKGWDQGYLRLIIGFNERNREEDSWHGGQNKV